MPRFRSPFAQWISAATAPRSVSRAGLKLESCAGRRLISSGTTRRVTFQSGDDRKVVLSIRKRAVDVVNDAQDAEEENRLSLSQKHL
jgi:hypothetical protein